MHGLAGLGTQQLYDDNPYQYLECEIAQNFTGIDITRLLTDKGLRNGTRSVNWYTILSNEWVEKAGGWHIWNSCLRIAISKSCLIVVAWQSGPESGRNLAGWKGSDAGALCQSE